MKILIFLYGCMLRILGMTICLSVLPTLAPADQEVFNGMALSETGEAALTTGDISQAISSFSQASTAFAEQDNHLARCEMLIKLAEAYQRKGEVEAAITTLNEALPVARQFNDAKKTASIFNRLGLWTAQHDQNDLSGTANTLLRSAPTATDQSHSEHDPAKQYLADALHLAQAVKDDRLTSSILNNRGIVSASRYQYPEAMQDFKESANLAERFGDIELAAVAASNYAFAATRRREFEQAEAYADKAEALFKRLTSSTQQAKGFLKVGQLYRTLAEKIPERTQHFRQRAAKNFVEASTIASLNKDLRTLSYAYGYLGQVHEERHEYDQALHVTRRALFAAQETNAIELLVLWEWQIGRILRQQGDIDGAINAYQQATTNLQAMLQSLENSCLSRTISYKETIEPVYKELTDLLFSKAEQKSNEQEVAPYLLEARNTVETLKFAELQDYLKNSCLEELPSAASNGKVTTEKTAIIYMICLSARVELLLTLPEGIKRVTIPNPNGTVTDEVKKFRLALQDITSDEYLTSAKRLHDILFRPLESELNRRSIDMLVFIPDDVFRSIPLAALHDGTDFLINKYAIATSLGMKFTVPRPRREGRLTMLTAGISESVHNFPALPYVATEVSTVNSLFAGDLLLNQNFNIAQLKKQVEQKQYTYFHLATHGEFSGDINQSSILAWDGKLTIDQFGRLVKATQLKNAPLELLTLSACNTALGDDRAILGIAGVAIQSGALSSLATLWGVDDKITSELMTNFYQQLKDTSRTKAQALQQAQIAALQHHRHPFFWSPFLLIGNWL